MGNPIWRALRLDVNGRRILHIKYINSTCNRRFASGSGVRFLFFCVFV